MRGSMHKTSLAHRPLLGIHEHVFWALITTMYFSPVVLVIIFGLLQKR